MKYIEVEGIKVHWNFKLLPKGFEAITLFGNIFFRDSKEYVLSIIDTYEGRITINHERIHMLQANSFKTRYFGFYLFYIYYWIAGLFKYGLKDDISYAYIPFEIEAYENQENFNYEESHWKDYR